MMVQLCSCGDAEDSSWLPCCQPDLSCTE